MNKAPFNDQFLRACRGEETDHTPVWYMRQAGRYQAEYRKIRQKYSFHEMNLNPEVAAEVTRFAVEQLGVDSAILFADIMTPLPSIGVDVEIKSGIGPVIDNPIQSRSDVDRLGELDPLKDVPYVMETIKMLREQLSVPLIGFSGAPFTVASYMIEGGPSKNYHKTKAFMYTDPEGWHQLMNKLGDMTIAYLTAQVKAGAQAVQLFDSWVGALNEADYRTYIAPVMNRIFSSLKELGVPLLMFGVGASHLIQEWNKLPVDVIGIDWRITIKKAREVEGITKPLMGNLEPALLLAPWEVIEERTKEILDQGMQSPGFIFNLGHGVFPQVKVETLQRLTSFVHDYTRKNS
ncbi:uroporphyrinogen decarboxylase [Pseudalkalibacillus hwajinpoensis]|uniref:Uroporphyrinogen decarboxylase n=1 Tax=Guptibacillus hwajinpoensis TaxID=208199 RepID=A0A4U1MC73_9BACL|nr:uroporphyrinogen decarboxylase [Pseudalkalibacillus hwajinpoensis]TKD68709.1 uroporphyrinogen decarboxylase [Pseudalkalibacillus hwajinpoensis]